MYQLFKERVTVWLSRSSYNVLFSINVKKILYDHLHVFILDDTGTICCIYEKVVICVFEIKNK
jgi:hypothetical protein